MNRSLLAGPEGHPFHPLLVPLPIGAFVSSLLFDILTRTRAGGLPYLVDGAFWLLGVGLIGGCELRTRGRAIRLVSPRLFHDEARRDIRPVERQVLRVLGIADFLSLKTAPAAPTTG